ncbi:MAG: phage tail family protein [Clostridiales bacterium]|nr:phage tail family protein [Clostridiales bacterium]
MRNGFSFKGQHCSKFGIIPKTKAAVIFPSPKLYSYSPLLYDGSYDFSECNSFGRTFYGDRVFELEMQLGAADYFELRQKAAKIAAWLCGSGELIFDEANSVQWTARVASEMSFSPERGGKKAVIGVIFSVGAMGHAGFDTSEGPRLYDGAVLGSALPLDMSGYFSGIKLNARNNKITFINIGDFYARPVFKISGADMVVIGNGTDSVSVSSAGGNAVIDFEHHTATDFLGNSLMNTLEGEFFELGAGKTELNIYCDGESVMDICYTPRCMFDFSFEDIEWEEENAQTL